jgi:hypothetical protein
MDLLDQWLAPHYPDKSLLRLLLLVKGCQNPVEKIQGLLY